MEPHQEKTCFQGFNPDLTQTRLHSHKRWLKPWKLEFMKKRDCTSFVAKTKVLLSWALTAQVNCILVFTNAESRFSHDEAPMQTVLQTMKTLIRHLFQERSDLAWYCLPRQIFQKKLQPLVHYSYCILWMNDILSHTRIFIFLFSFLFVLIFWQIIVFQPCAFVIA